MAKYIKLLAVRVHNITKSCLLVWRYNEGVWALPTITIPRNADPMNHIPVLLQQIEGEFKLVSAIQIVDYPDTDDDDGTEHHCVIYDVDLSGVVMPTLTKHVDAIHKHSQWIQKAALKQKTPVNYPTDAYLKFAEAL
jgi:hypothetical protein